MKSGVYASLDIGTTSIKIIVSEVLNDQLNVIGVGNERSTGLSRGMIVDIDQVATSIQNAVKQAEEKADVKIENLIVGVPVNDLKITPSYGSVSLNKNHQEITDQNVQKVIKKAIEGNLAQEREVVSLDLEEFVVDGFNEIRDPRGMIGNRIEFRGTLITIPRSIMHNIKKAVSIAGYGIKDVVLQPESMGQVALDEDERAFGSILIDMGGGQTNISVIHENQLKYAYVIQEGGEYVTKDISIVLNTSIKNAEKLKRDIGHAYSNEMNPDRTVAVEVVGQHELSNVKETYISEIIEARLEQIFEQLKYSIENIGALKMPAGIVISGGAASLPGIEQLAENIFGVPVRVYIPDFMSVRYPVFTNAIGMVIKETTLTEIEELINHTILGSASTYDVKEQQTINEHSQIEQERELSNESEVKEEKTAEPLSGKIRNFFSGFFD